jgi:putative toxin-antitoxin system antitoxin component (TIGR02293 family)
MAKKILKLPTNYLMDESSESNLVSEAPQVYGAKKTKVFFAKYTYKQMEKIMQKTLFDLKDWASFLQISERTLQRYAVDNKPFDNLQSERIFQLEKLFTRGADVFGDIKSFCHWINNEPPSLHGNISKSWLASFTGTQYIEHQLGRIEHGIYS